MTSTDRDGGEAGGGFAGRCRNAYLDQWSATRSWCDSLDVAAAQTPSSLRNWSVLDLVAHFGLVADSLVVTKPARSNDPALSIAQYVASYAGGAAVISERTKSMGASTVTAVLTEVDRSATAARNVLLDPTRSGNSVVEARRGPIRWADFVITRCLELSVHTDDLARSFPDGVGPPLQSACLKVVVRSMTTVLAEQAPGRSVEVRVPPFAAVQMVAGPRHSRGTPSAVVEMSPITMLRLAAGRQDWGVAVSEGLVRASGERADLSSRFPLLS